MKPQANDSAFFPHRVEFTTGVEVEVPRFTLRKDERVRHLIQKTLQENQTGLSAALLGGQSIVALIGLALSSATDDLIKIGSYILDKPEDWVTQNSATSDLVGLVKSLVLTPVSQSDERRVREKGEVWTLARLIDFMAQEYGWTVDEVLELTRWEMKAVLEAASQRHEEQRKAMEDASRGRGRQKQTGMYGKKSFVQPSRPKNISPEESEKSVNALRAFAKATGIYEKQGGDDS